VQQNPRISGWKTGVTPTCMFCKAAHKPLGSVAEAYLECNALVRVQALQTIHVHGGRVRIGGRVLGRRQAR
jgi:hypothetical protein